MRMNIYAIIAWMKAALINGWLGTPVLNPEFARDADRHAAPAARPSTSTSSTAFGSPVSAAATSAAAASPPHPRQTTAPPSAHQRLAS